MSSCGNPACAGCVKCNEAMTRDVVERGKPSAGAMRAATAIDNGLRTGDNSTIHTLTELAALIDRESGLGELRERAAWAVKILSDPSKYSDQQREICARRLAGALAYIEEKEKS